MMKMTLAALVVGLMAVGCATTKVEVQPDAAAAPAADAAAAPAADAAAAPAADAAAAAPAAPEAAKPQ